MILNIERLSIILFKYDFSTSHESVKLKKLQQHWPHAFWPYNASTNRFVRTFNTVPHQYYGHARACDDGLRNDYAIRTWKNAHGHRWLILRTTHIYAQLCKCPQNTRHTHTDEINTKTSKSGDAGIKNQRQRKVITRIFMSISLYAVQFDMQHNVQQTIDVAASKCKSYIGWPSAINTHVRIHEQTCRAYTIRNPTNACRNVACNASISCRKCN